MRLQQKDSEATMTTAPHESNRINIEHDDSYEFEFKPVLSIAVVKAYGGTSDGQLNRMGSHF
jgi:hypothetical protein